MAKLTVLQWPASNATLIANTQNVLSGASFLLNTAPLVYSGLPNCGNYILQNQQRKLTFTSSNNMSGVNIVVTGKDMFGTTVTETIAGPNNNTVTTTNSYNVLVSAIPNGNLTGVSIGSGSSGSLSWVQFSSFNPIFQASVQTVVTGTINYSIVQTLDYPQDATINGLVTKTPTAFPIPSLNNDQSTPVYSPLTALTANSLYAFPNVPITAVQCIVNSSSAGGSLVFTVLQQGVN